MSLFFKSNLNDNYFIKLTKNFYKACQSHKKLNQKGMTLIEIMIVLIIIGGLASVLAPNVMRQLRRGNIDTAKIQIREIGKQLNLFYADCGFYPDDLESLVEAPDNCPSWGPESYMKKLPKDPWNAGYVYELKGSDYVLTSEGADKRPGGTGSDKDISSADL